MQLNSQHDSFAQALIDKASAGLTGDALRSELESVRQKEGISRSEALTRIKKEGAIREREFQTEINALTERKDLLEHYAAVQGNITPARAIQKFKDTFPEIWESVCPRIYKHTDNYGDYRLAYLEWGWAHVLNQRHIEDEELNTYPHQMVLDSFNLHKKHGFPFFL